MSSILGGFRLRGARVDLGLDLDHVQAVVGLTLIGCALNDPFTARQAKLPFLVLRGSSLAHFDADELRVDGDLVLEGARIRGAGEPGAIRLIGAYIGGELDCEDTEITNDSGPAVRADGVTSTATCSCGEPLSAAAVSGARSG